MNSQILIEKWEFIPVFDGFSGSVGKFSILVGKMILLKAIFEDLAEILALQKLAYLSEAKLHNNYSIKPLLQTLDELEKEFEKNI
ncbi:MAG: hypothetical protein LBU89_04340 [Fibromonadaceae bacterium]|jgi:hypothetical protein|nr:hypothetical protein [Fibromonadaceae bacterium]